jgi:hypothetical protein
VEGWFIVTKSADERVATANAEKAEAEARSASAAAEKAEYEVQQLKSAASDEKRQAEIKKLQADADRAASEARQAQIGKYIPDFSKIERGETTVAGDKPLFSSVLTHRALTKAVEQLAEVLVQSLVHGEPVLITDDPDLATSDAAYLEVKAGLEQLQTAAAALLDEAKPTDVGDEDFRKGVLRMLVPAAASLVPAVGQAVAAAVPPLVSLFSAQRSVNTSSVTAQSAVTIALVAGALTKKGRVVRIDDFRLVPDGQIFELEKDVRQSRTELIRKKIGLEQDRVLNDTLRVSEQGRIDQLTKQIDAVTAPDDPNLARWEQEREGARRVRDEAAALAKTASIRTGLIDALTTSIDGFLAAAHKVPEGGSRSPIVLASLREELRAPAGNVPDMPRILYLTAASGSAEQLFNDRPLILKDWFHTMASVSLSYWLIDSVTSNVLTAGVAMGSVEMKVQAGDRFIIVEDDAAS